jgi:hypothetical protein
MGRTRARRAESDRWYPVDGLLFSLLVSMALWALILFGVHRLLD